MYKLNELFVAFLAYQNEAVINEIEEIGLDVEKGDVINYLSQIKTNDRLLKAGLKATIAQNNDKIPALRTIGESLDERIPNLNTSDVIALLN